MSDEVPKQISFFLVCINLTKLNSIYKHLSQKWHVFFDVQKIEQKIILPYYTTKYKEIQSDK